MTDRPLCEVGERAVSTAAATARRHEQHQGLTAERRAQINAAKYQSKKAKFDELPVADQEAIRRARADARAEQRKAARQHKEDQLLELDQQVDDLASTFYLPSTDPSSADEMLTRALRAMQQMHDLGGVPDLRHMSFALHLASYDL